MKKIFTLFAALFLVAFSFAQLPDGSYAPDFNLYEIDKTTGEMIQSPTIGLYPMLNDYKTVYIDVSATTCNPCLTFHSSGTLESIYNSYGPNSSVNDSRVLFIEGARTGGTWAAINGSAGSGYWDCTHAYNSTELVPYPVIPLYIEPNFVSSNANCNYYTFHEGYAIAYFPTIYMVCPNRMIFNMSNTSANAATSYHNQIATKCPAWTHTNDALLGTQKLMSSVYYCDNGINPKVVLQNLGSAPLTSATLRITYGSDVQTYDWTGNLAQFETEEVSLSPITPTQDGTQSITVEIVSANGVTDEGTSYNTHTETFSVQRTSDLATASQDFSSSNFGAWTLVDYTGGECGRASNALRFRAYNISSGTAEFYAPLMNFSNNAEPTLNFDVAYSRYYYNGAPYYSDQMQVLVSGDCGTTWVTVYDKEGEELETYAASGEFNSPANHYRREIVDLSDFAGNEHVIVKFVFISGYGNNIFVDNIRITDGPLAIENVDNNSLAIFPNPVKDVLTINYDKTISQIDVYDVNGKFVKTYTTVGSSINVSDLSDGVYMLNIQTEEGLVVRKIVKE